MRARTQQEKAGLTVRDIQTRLEQEPELRTVRFDPNIKPSPDSEADVSSYKWCGLFFLVVIVAGACAARGFSRSTRPTLHDQLISILPEDGCRPVKARSVSKAVVCDVDGESYFVKKIFKEKLSDHEKNAKSDQPGIISYEEFNRQFVRNNIGAAVPRTRFFKKDNVEADADKRHYIGSAEVRDLEILTAGEDVAGVLSEECIAKLVVVSTFIRDFHIDNWGFSNKRLVVIDVDSRGNIPSSISDYIDIAIKGISEGEVKLSLDRVLGMKRIYEKMQHTSLPKFHDEFLLTNEMYQDLLKIYIGTCDNTISYLRSMKSNEATIAINNEFIDQLRKYKVNHDCPFAYCRR